MKMCIPHVYAVFFFLTCVGCNSIHDLQNTPYEKFSKFPFPKTFAECTDFLVRPNTPKDIVQAVQNHCLDGFVSIDHTHSWTKNLTRDEQNYIRSVFRKVISDADNLDKTRHKRDVGLFPRRLRREVRAAPYQHWADYARNVRRLKYETIDKNGRSKYNVLADIHGIAVSNSHFGPNFLPWHRLYLILMESALGTPLTYWDSTIDQEIEDCTQSILWTEKYFGNGFGMVKTGPFANFDTPLGKLFRNIGSDGALFSKSGVNIILSRSRFQQISEPFADTGASVEGQHNSKHVWVDGVINNLGESPHDPVFFCLHTFVDYIWELFRKQQIMNGIDPTTDTVLAPNDPEISFQNSTDVSVGLRGYYNIDGYSKRIADMVKYEPHPQCPICAGSQDLYCDKRKGVCLTRNRDPREYAGRQEEARSLGYSNKINNNGPNTKPFPIYGRDIRVRMDSVTLDYDNISLTASLERPPTMNIGTNIMANSPLNLGNEQRIDGNIRLMSPQFNRFTSLIQNQDPRPTFQDSGATNINLQRGPVHVNVHQPIEFRGHNRGIKLPKY
ncbi:tyrosinase-like protein 1 [Mytilus californianus]|uniref:tyrosinase-like protein 1 n=1 Tax=Mytilus californianus TaxID=6549 RepID=UPI0022452A7D|nr:tyrosinase-like protein 1 [Mytilus californianus]